MDDFVKLLSQYKNSIERYIFYKISSKDDAEDVLQEVYFTAYQKFDTLKNKNSFNTWIIAIARNKCNDYYKANSKKSEISFNEQIETNLSYSIYGRNDNSIVNETLELLNEKEREIIYLFYYCNMSQVEISNRLEIPIGTVKSRLFNVKKSFREKYPYYSKPKGDIIMTKLPEYLPKYEIKKIDKPAFSVKCEELMGWLIIPRLNEKLSWAIYDMPTREIAEHTEIEVIGKAEVHGIEGVEIKAVQYDARNEFQTDSNNGIERTFVAQLTETHSRYLAESHTENGIKKCYTFLDGEAFLKNWGYGNDNCGNEINLSSKGLIKRNKNVVDCKNCCQDIVGRYEITINNKTYDTVCLMNIEYFDKGILIEQFIDKNGHTILWKRYNKNDWAFEKYNQLWSEKLPNNDILKVNDEIFVNWYDCISNYIL